MIYNQEQYVRKAGLFTSRHISCRVLFSRDWRQQKQNTPFSNNDYLSVSGAFLCFKVRIERVTLTEYNVNFIEFPDL